MSLLSNEKLTNMFVFDAETVTRWPSYDQVPQEERVLWDKVSKRYLGEKYETASIEDKRNCYQKNAGLFAEFSKIVSIAIGAMKGDFVADVGTVRGLVNHTSDDEKTILEKFVENLKKAVASKNELMLAGHNIAGFDIPLIVKRLIYHRIPIPEILIRCIEAKPWDQPVYDTIRVWKFGSTEFVSLDAICFHLGIPSPKVGVVTGANLSEYYYNTTASREEILANIAAYNKADVIAVMDVLKALVKL